MENLWTNNLDKGLSKLENQSAALNIDEPRQQESDLILVNEHPGSMKTDETPNCDSILGTKKLPPSLTATSSRKYGSLDRKSPNVASIQVHVIDQDTVANEPISKVGVKLGHGNNGSFVDLSGDDTIISQNVTDCLSNEYLSSNENESDDLSDLETISSDTEEEQSDNQDHSVQNSPSVLHEIAENTLILPPQKMFYNCKSQKLCQGLVSNMDMEDSRGMIRILPHNARLEDISFDFEDVKNTTDSMLFLTVGSHIHFERDSRDIKNATIVFADSESSRVIGVPLNKSEKHVSSDETEEQASDTINMVSRTLYKKSVTILKNQGQDGTIISFNPNRGFGFIGNQQLEKYVFVHVSRLFTNGMPIIPQKGMKVRFVLGPNPNHPKNIRADFALIVNTSRKSHQMRPKMQSQHGSVVSICATKKEALLNCTEMDKQIHMDLRKISEFTMPLKCGDEVAFQVDSSATKSSAFRVLRYVANRSHKEFSEFLDSALETLQSSKSVFMIFELASLDGLWQYFGNPVVQEHIDLVWKIQKFLTHILKQSRSDVDLDHILEILAQPSHFLENVAKLELKSVIDNAQIVLEFCEQVIEKCPKYVIKIFPLMTMTPKPLFEKLLLRQLTSKTGPNNERVSWRSMAEGISNEELFRDDLVKEDNNLTMVKSDVPYDSEMQYMDTYFRLLRAEAFHAIQEGFSCLRKGTLKPFQMKVYEGISLGGIDLDNLNLALCISREQRKKISLSTNNHLMPGNLLCLLLNHQLKQVIWMTVGAKDPDILKSEGYVMAEMCSFNTLTKTEIVSALYSAGGKITMMESPTYFKSIYPALQSFRKIDLETLKLRDSIVHAISSQERPSYQLEYLGGSDLLGALENEDNMQKITEMEDFMEKQMATMDDSQKRAFKHVLHSPLGIIQGPPGIGKTYIGTKVIQTILKYEVDSPILVLTYKNHALDEFLKQCLKFCPIRHLVRVGGRSKEPALDSCNLFEVMKTVELSHTINESKFNLRESKEELTLQLKEVVKSLWADLSVNAESLLYALTEDQLNDLIRGAPWGKGQGKINYTTTKKHCANDTWVCNIFDKIILKFESLQNFLQSFSRSQNTPKEDQVLCEHAKALLDLAVHQWLPSLQKLENLRDLHSEFDISHWVEDAKEQKYMREEDLRDQECRDEMLGNRDSFHHCEGPMQKPRQFCKVPEHILSSSSFTREHFPSDLEANPLILRTKQMWALSDGERYRFVFSLIRKQQDETLSTVEEAFRQMERLIEKQEHQNRLKKIQALQRKKIIGMTITGASIHSCLLKQIKAKVVIVEEAAEVLEPQLVAALNESVEHLILIGDHQQLRPHVESFSLVKDFDFDISMMERLIRCQFPYTALSTQSRMRPEFAELLLDIYSEYKTNMDHVAKNGYPTYMAKSMFFWTHAHHEDKNERGSKTNIQETNLVIALTQYLINNGVDPQKITILAAYLGQVELIRSKLHTMTKGEAMPSVQTIDMFQGDENDVIIVSLVRSNHHGNIGFLNSINRRCVLQSRARCGFYLVGNEKTLIQGKGANVWQPLVSAMEKQGCLGPKLPLKCNYHPSHVEVSTYKELNDIFRNPSKLCSKVCGVAYTCQIHICNKTCFPQHCHTKCLTKVKATFSPCGHGIIKPCWKDIDDLDCMELIDRVLKCGHLNRGPCFYDVSKIVCNVPCSESMLCADKHACRNKCGKPHNHFATSCEAEVSYCYPECHHPSPVKKKCGLEVKWKCSFEIKFTGTCGHLLMKKCFENEKDIKCKNPCSGKLRSCGHFCFNRCGENCDTGHCLLCKKDIEAFQNKAKKRVKQLKLKLKKEEEFSLTDLDKSDAQFSTVQDKVSKYVQPMHNWSPVITRIQLVRNVKREIAYERLKSKGFGTYEDLKFHGTSEEGVNKIPKEGFRMPGVSGSAKKLGMFGAGIYFATDSSKSAQEIYTKNSNKLLLCKVFLGKCLTLREPNNQMNRFKLKNLKSDSVFAPRGTSVKNDEFVVYHQDQAYPKYIIHFYTSGLAPRSQFPVTSTALPLRRVLKPSRKFNASNPDDLLYRIAESSFYRCGQKTNRKIKSVEHVTNPSLESDFHAQKIEFKKNGIPDHEILAFHGTSSANVDNILKINLSLLHSHGFVHGRGLYFSEYPNISLGYGNTLLLFKVLPGNEYVGNNLTWANFQSKTVNKSNDGYGHMVIVDNPKQFHPLFIYNLD